MAQQVADEDDRLPYAGAVTSPEALERLRRSPDAVLVDVRTYAEWRYVGHPDLSAIGRAVLFVSWQSFPDGARNPSFVEDVSDAVGEGDPEIFLLCRSGQRSHHAAVALTEAGYSRCWNISDGFEGPKDEAGHRGTVAGWRHHGLPWTQD